MSAPLLFLAAGIWFIGIFIPSVDRYNEDNEHHVSAQTQDHCLSECRQTYRLKYTCLSFVMGVVCIYKHSHVCFHLTFLLVASCLLINSDNHSDRYKFIPFFMKMFYIYTN
ncbi:hypothetical protein HanPSC8_Chr10g0446291 [Helianthus annuus]|nr:hypothetical protein HanPSC8_Chr10g0446291 [Helianthus annuus]